jgi:hypothetical protein
LLEGFDLTQRDGKLLETMLCWRVSTSHSEGWEVARLRFAGEFRPHTRRDAKLLDYVLLESFDLTLGGKAKLLDYVLLESFDLTLRGKGLTRHL